MNASEISARLADRIEDLAETLFGAPPTFRTRAAIRYYPRGGMVIEITGSRRGLWCSHGEGGIGGDALDLVKRVRQCSTVEAIKWAEAWLGKPYAPRPRARAYNPPPKTEGVQAARRLWHEAIE